MEGSNSYQCNNHMYDCHLLVVDRSQGKLYGGWGAATRDSKINAKFIAVWDLNRVYPPSGRGDQRTSADARRVFLSPRCSSTPTELAKGSINHALRFYVFPTEHIRAHVFVHPATHAALRLVPTAPPMGVRIRLKASYDLSGMYARGASRCPGDANTACYRTPAASTSQPRATKTRLRNTPISISIPTVYGL